MPVLLLLGGVCGCVCVCLGVDLVGVLSALVNDVTKPDVRMSFTASQPAQVKSPAPPRRGWKQAQTGRQASDQGLSVWLCVCLL